MSLLWNSRSTAAGNKISKDLWWPEGFNILVWTSIFRWFHISALSPQVSIVDICWVHTAVGSEISQLWSTKSGLFWCSLYCIQIRPNSRWLVLLSGVSDANHPLLWPKTLYRWPADHVAWWALFLISISLNHASLCWVLSAAWRSLSRWFLP